MDATTWIILICVAALTVGILALRRRKQPQAAQPSYTRPYSGTPLTPEGKIYNPFGSSEERGQYETFRVLKQPDGEPIIVGKGGIFVPYTQRPEVYRALMKIWGAKSPEDSLFDYRPEPDEQT